MIGGVTLNGQQIYMDAMSDIEKLEQEIRKPYELNRNDDRVNDLWYQRTIFKAAKELGIMKKVTRKT